jgi:hypothetical protein
MLPDEYQDIWIKDDKVSWYRETLKHTFWEPNLNDTRIGFVLSRRGNDNPLLLTIQDGFESKAGDDSLTIRFEGDIPSAKKMILDSFKVFDFNRTTEKKIDIYQIRDYFNLHKEVSIQNAGEIVFENMSSRASMIEKLTSHLGKEHQLDWKTALSCIKLYKSTFGDEGLAAIDKKIDFLSKYTFEKPDADGLMQIKFLEHRLYTLKDHQFHNYENKKAYKSFIENEKENNAHYLKNTSFENTQAKVEASTYHISHIPHIPMKHKNGGIQAGILQIKEEMIKNGESPPLERRQINSKEKNMSNERQEDSAYDEYMSSLNTTIPLGEEKKELSPKQQAYIEAANNARFQRKVVADAIKAGTLSCLPGKDGYADITPAVNIMTPHKPYHGDAQLFLKAFQKQEQNGFPTAEYVTYHQIDKAREANNDLYVLKGQKGVSLIIGEQKDTGEWENKNIRLFNVAQINNPKAFKEWAAKEIENQAQKDLEHWQTQHGTGSKPPEKQKEKGPDEIVCSSTEPEKYLGQFLAAVSMGSKFKVSPVQAKEFSEKMLEAMYAPMKPIKNEQTGEIRQPPLNKETDKPITDPFCLENICIAANKECKEFMRDFRMQTQQQKNPEIKQEQEQSREGFKR